MDHPPHVDADIANLGKPRVSGKPTDAQLANRFSSHPPKGDQAERYARIRTAALHYAKIVRDETSCSAEQTRAINAIHDSMMLSNSAIAINE